MNSTSNHRLHAVIGHAHRVALLAGGERFERKQSPRAVVIRPDRLPLRRQQRIRLPQLCAQGMAGVTILDPWPKPVRRFLFAFEMTGCGRSSARSRRAKASARTSSSSRARWLPGATRSERSPPSAPAAADPRRCREADAREAAPLRTMTGRAGTISATDTIRRRPRVDVSGHCRADQ